MNTAAALGEIPPSAVAALPVADVLPFPTQPQADNFIRMPQAPVPNQLVITFKPETSAPERAAYITSLGGQVIQTIDALDTVVIEISGQAANLLLPVSNEIVTAEPDYYVSAQVAVPPSDPLYSEQWGLHAVGAPDVWLSLPADAPNVAVAVIDSGVCLENPDLQGRLLPGWDFVEHDSTPQDEFGHGCGVAGIIAANADDGVGMAGVAPNALILPLRVLDARGIGTYSNVAAALIYAADHGVQVVNLSLGGIAPSSLLEQAVSYAVGKGVTVIAAAGNSGSAQVLYPAAYTSVLAVGSVDQDLQVSSFSNGGTNVDLLAPGRNILSLKRDGSYGTMSGTSFAAPYVAGVAALEAAFGRQLVSTGALVYASGADALPGTPVPPVPSATVVPGEGETTITGWLTTIHGDPQSQNDEGFVVTLLRGMDGTTLAQIDIKPEAARAYVGQEVTISGSVSASVLSRGFGRGSLPVIVPESITPISGMAQAAAITGSYPYINLLCKLPDVATTPQPASAYPDLFAATAPGLGHYWQELSYGIANITGTAITSQWVTLPQPSTSYNLGFGIYDLDTMLEDCAAAADSEVNYLLYKGINAFFNLNFGDFSYGGSGYMMFLDGQWRSYGVTWLAPWVDHGVVAHEMGHSFGLSHSSGPAFPPPGSGSIYVSRWDVMSRSGGTCVSQVTNFGCAAQGTNAYYASTLGWIPGGRIASVANTTSQTVTLERLLPNSTSNTSTLLARIPILGSSTKFYTVEARDVATYDQNIPSKGVVIYYVDLSVPWNSNAGPALVVDGDGNGNVNDAGAQWLPGEAYADCANRIFIDVLSQSGDTFTVNISNNVSPANDLIANAVPLSSQPCANTQNNINTMTTTAGDPAFCTTVSQTVWYKYAPAITQTLSIDTIGSSYDTVLAVFDAGTLASVGCDNNGGGGTASALSIPLSRGKTYLIGIGVNGAPIGGTPTLALNTTPTGITFPYTVPAGDVTALVDAITLANGNGAGTNDVINLTNSTYTLTEVTGQDYAGDYGLPIIPSAATAGTLTINGSGATIARSSAGGTANFGILRLYTGADVSLNQLTLTNGSAESSGGAVFSEGALKLTSVTVSNNFAPDYGGGIYNQDGRLDAINSTFSGNSTDSYGGALYSWKSSGAALVTIAGSTFNSNTAGNSGAGIYNNSGTMLVNSSTFSGNSTGFGGGAFNLQGTMVISNSTFTANTTSSVGAGVYNYSPGGSGTVFLNNSTLSGNTGSYGSAIYNYVGTVKLNNTIVANNSGVECANDDVFQANYSLVKDGSCGVTNGVNGNKTGDPNLGTLTGSPAYFPLNTGSLAIDAGSNSLLGEAAVGVDFNGDGDTSDTLTTDQTGAARINGVTVDMGAVEYLAGGASPTISDVTNKTTNEDTQTPLIPFTIGDPDTPLGSLTVTGTSSNQTRVPNANITITGTGANRNVRIKPAANQFGNVTITLTVSDGTNTATDTFVLSITAVNDAPTITNVANQSTNQNTPITIPFTVGDVDSNSSALTVTGSSNSQARVPNANIVFGGNGANRTVTLTPVLNATGNARITICVSDGTASICDDFVLSIVVPPDAIFSDSFESGDFSAWTANANGGGDLSVTAGAALLDSYGLRALINDATPIHVTDDTPNNEMRYRARFYFDPNSITMATNETLFLFFGYQGDSTVTFRLQLRRTASSYQLRTGVLTDGGTTLYGAFVNISDAPHLVEIDWQAASGAGANNGALTLWVDDVQQTTQTGIDNDTARVDRVRLGAVTGIQAGTNGTIYFDGFASKRFSYIGYAVAAPTLINPANAAQVNRETTLTLTWNSVVSATEYYVEFGSLNSGWISTTSWSPGSQPQGAYTWRVKARNASGDESLWSASRTLTIRPGVPTNLQGTAVGLTQVNLTWTASVDAPNGISSYRIYRGGVQIGTANKNTPSFIDTNAVACAANQYKVRAINGTVSSPDSTPITVNTPCDPIFSDGFESRNMNAWSAAVTDGTDLAVSAASQLTSSTRGIRGVINDANPLYVQDDTPDAEARYRSRFYFDPNSITMANNDNFTLFQGYQGASTLVLQIQLRRSGSSYQVRAGTLDDAGTWAFGGFVTISDAAHILETDWQTANADGANNGSLTLWVDEVQQTAQTGINNDTRRIDRVRMGVTAGIDAGTKGVVYFDAFRSTRLSYIGAEVGGLGVDDEPEAEPTAEITPEVTPEVTDDPTVEPTVTPDAPTIEPTETPTAEPTIEPTLLPFSVPVYQTMDDGAPLWSASAGWQLSAESAYSGLGWQAAASGNVETLTLNVPVNLAGASVPMLSFQSKLVSGVLPEVRISLDSVNWHTVASVTPSLNWALVTVDLSAYAGQTIQLQFLWTTPVGMGDTWQVDEVMIAEGALLPPSEPTGVPVPTITPEAPGIEPPIYIPTPQPREGGGIPDAPADLPSAPMS